MNETAIFLDSPGPTSPDSGVMSKIRSVPRTLVSMCQCTEFLSGFENDIVVYLPKDYLSGVVMIFFPKSNI